MDLSLVKKIIQRSCSLLPFKLGKSFFSSQVLIINYHSIDGADVDESINAQNTYRTELELKEDLKFFKRNFNILTLQEFIDHSKRGTSVPPNSILFTIDDGLRPFYEKMFPVFKELNIPATLFLNSAFIDNNDLHFERKAHLLAKEIQNCNNQAALESVANIIGVEFKNNDELSAGILQIAYSNKNLLKDIAQILEFDTIHYLKTKKPYLETEELTIMLDQGITLGGHSIDHPNYVEIDLEEQLRQTIESIDFIQNLFKLNYRVFAFPYKDAQISKIFFDSVRKKVDVCFGTNGIKKDSIGFNFQRISIERSGLSARTALNAEFAKYIGKSILNQHKIQRW